MAKTISITCYGEAKLRTSRKKAIDFYQRAIAACEEANVTAIRTFILT